MSNFPCTQCGQCCRMVRSMLLFKEAISPGMAYYKEMNEFPYKADARGACEKLTTDGKCSVYDNRPDLCNIETIRQRYFDHLTTAEYYSVTAGHCNNMMEIGGVDASLRVEAIKQHL